jgi:hypothetical protein
VSTPYRATWTGLEELKAALRQLPTDLAEEAADIVQARTNAVVSIVKAAYHRGPTGNLISRVSGKVERSQFGVVAEMRSAAKHVWIYERGTQARQSRKRGHAKAGNRGRSPAHGEIFVETIVQQRALLQAQLVALLRRAGLEVH